MKNLLKLGTLILFVGLIGSFVAYKAGAFNSKSNKVPSSTLQVVSNSPETIVKNSIKPVLPSVDVLDSPVKSMSDTVSASVLDIDSLIKLKPLIYSSKSFIVHEKWDEHAAAVAKFVKQMDSIKELDSIQRAKEWETVSPR